MDGGKAFSKLAIFFRLDGAISLLFGLSTMLFQAEIFSTAVDLKSANSGGRGDSLIEAALFTLSGYYILVGSILLVCAKIPPAYAVRLCALITLHHAAMAGKGILEAGRSWVTGNPWWDVAIHTAFVTAYLACLILGAARQPPKTPTS